MAIPVKMDTHVSHHHYSMTLLKIINAAAHLDSKNQIKTVNSVIIQPFSNSFIFLTFIINFIVSYCDFIGQPCQNGHKCTSSSKYTQRDKTFSCNCSKGYKSTDKNCVNCNSCFSDYHGFISLYPYALFFTDSYCDEIGNPCKHGHSCFSSSKPNDEFKYYRCNCSEGFVKTKDKRCENCKDKLAMKIVLRNLSLFFHYRFILS